MEVSSDWKGTKGSPWVLEICILVMVTQVPTSVKMHSKYASDWRSSLCYLCMYTYVDVCIMHR